MQQNLQFFYLITGQVDDFQNQTMKNIIGKTD